MSHIDLKGASGACYRFRPASEARTPMSGGYVYVRREGDQALVVFAAVADNLLTDHRSRWAEAVSQHGATDIFVRLNVSRSARLDEMNDIAQGYQPPMNLAPADA